MGPRICVSRGRQHPKSLGLVLPGLSLWGSIKVAPTWAEVLHLYFIRGRLELP